MITRFIKLQLLVLFVFWALMTTGRAQTAVSDPSPQIAGGTIMGVWYLNAAKSDDMARKIDELMARKSKVALSSGSEDLPSLSIYLTHPEQIMLAAGDNGEVTINELFNTVIQTRTFVADGQGRMYDIPGGSSAMVTGKLTDASLTTMTISPRGNRMVETYELSPKDHQLHVSITIADASSIPLLTLNRVFDRAPLDAGADDEG